MRLLLIALAFACFNALAATTYYVDGTNSAASDANPGTQVSPWKTIGHATSTATAGDTVLVQPGTYAETLTLQSGVTFSGTRGTNGEWLTILDPSTPLTNWYAAPEVGSGVFKATNSFVPYELTIGKQRCAYVHTMGTMTSDIANAWNTNWTTGAQVMSQGSNVVVTGKESPAGTIYMWDGIKALWGTTNDLTTNIVYLRFETGADPTGSNVCASPNGNGVRISGINGTTWENFYCRGSYIPIFIQGATTYGNTVRSNYLEAGYDRIYLATGPYQNTIADNVMTANYYGYESPGAWGSSVTGIYSYLIRKNLYATSKFLMGANSINDHGVEMFYYGNSNSIYGNTITNTLGGGILLSSGNPVSPPTATEIYANYISGNPSDALEFQQFQVGTKVYSNYCGDSNLNMRFHHLDTSGESNRLVYIYRNVFWEPNDHGDHIFMFHNDATPTADQATFWVYQNSFSGGSGILQDNGNGYGAGGLTNGFFINNVMSGAVYADPNSMQLAFWTNANMLGAFDYNLTTPPVPTSPASTNAAWFGSHCITNAAAVWPNLLGMSFQLPLGSKAIDAAIDTTASFTLAEPSGTNTYSALPKGGDTKIGSAWDIGALEFTPPAARANSIHVINSFFK